MDWIISTLNWYLYLLIIGLLAYPLTKHLFRSFLDKGYPFAKTVAILIISYVVFVLGVAKILPFTQTSLFALIGLYIIGYIYFNRKKKNLIPAIAWNRHLALFIFEELLFIASLFFLTFVRGQEPSLRGLEKFMDFGFINSILRSKFFPPLDMWYTGGFPINYYYFGHLTGALLIRLTDTPAAVGYNLILATIFAQGITLAFSLSANIVYAFHKSPKHAILTGLLGSFIVNLAGNLHTFYLFTKGYNTDAPVPFWQILSSYNPTKYWYPNATRFIPYTIHEFPSYSYVVADLHGHVFDIPFVLLTLSLLFVFFVKYQTAAANPEEKRPAVLPSIIMFGFLAAIHYMTNAFDGPIYMLLIGLLMLVMFGISRKLLIYGAALAGSFLVFSFPFSSHFSPFVSGIGVNCSPDALAAIGKFGPFLFEQGKCQPDPLWMLLILWGFFWVSFALFFLAKYFEQKARHNITIPQLAIDDFIFTTFTFGTILILIPEFFYIKDIYPAHFRANTMFKLGYQAFMIMGIASSYAAYRVSQLKRWPRIILTTVFILFFAFVFIYPFYSFPSYYGGLNRAPNLNGIQWLETYYPEDREIVDYLNENVSGQPTILEAQGDSYTDFERISANTGLPTVAGWWVHEWLWRGSADVVGKRIPEIQALYQSKDLDETKKLIQKYHIKYVVISRMEREKYQLINEGKFNVIAKKVFTSSNGFGALYKVN